MPKWIRLVILTVGLGGIWCAVSSLVLIGIDAFFGGILYRVYGFPSMLWQWWHYAFVYWNDAGTRSALLIAAVPATILLMVLAIVFARRWLRKPAQPLYGETRPATTAEMKAAGIHLRERR